LKKQTREEKTKRILEAAVSVLAEKGYENATIKDIARKANVNWGLLHYYFKDKEDLVVQALDFASYAILQSTSQLFASGKSIEATVDDSIELLKKNYRENPGFYKLLFEMWCASGRSKKIRTELVRCLNRITSSLQTELDKFLSNRTDGGSSSTIDSKELASLIIAMTDGLAFQMILEKYRIDNENLWYIYRNIILGLLRS
jgi:AcrR family transcriptional regulator